MFNNPVKCVILVCINQSESRLINPMETNKDINIANIDKAKLLQALFNNSKQLGLGFMDASGANDMSIDEAKSIVSDNEDRLYFDYLKGRVMKVNIGGDTMNSGGYDRDNGDGAALVAVNSIQ